MEQLHLWFWKSLNRLLDRIGCTLQVHYFICVRDLYNSLLKKYEVIFSLWSDGIPSVKRKAAGIWTGANFINVFHAPFSYKSLYSCYVLALNKLSCKKRAHKMLMKLSLDGATRCQFHQHFSYKRWFGSFFYIHVTRKKAAEMTQFLFNHNVVSDLGVWSMFLERFNTPKK